MGRPTARQKKAKKARELRQNKTLVSIFEERELDIFSRWKGSTTTEERELCYFEMKALEGLMDAIDAAGTE